GPVDCTRALEDHQIPAWFAPDNHVVAGIVRFWQRVVSRVVNRVSFARLGAGGDRGKGKVGVTSCLSQGSKLRVAATLGIVSGSIIQGPVAGDVGKPLLRLGLSCDHRPCLIEELQPCTELGRERLVRVMTVMEVKLDFAVTLESVFA